jgi:hypothetical protein
MGGWLRKERALDSKLELVLHKLCAAHWECPPWTLQLPASWLAVSHVSHGHRVNSEVMVSEQREFTEHVMPISESHLLQAGRALRVH